MSYYDELLSIERKNRIDYLEEKLKKKDMLFTMITELWDEGITNYDIQKFIKKYNKRCDCSEMKIGKTCDELFIARQIAERGLKE